jgi:hypothetical protein
VRLGKLPEYRSKVRPGERFNPGLSLERQGSATLRPIFFLSRKRQSWESLHDVN